MASVVAPEKARATLETYLERRDRTALTPEAYAVGTTIAGKYRVERLIGEGAMGVVLAARHLDLDEIVAIKFVRPEMQAIPGVVSRFAHEAKAAVRLKSEHVASVLDVGIAEPFGPYIVMEYLEGSDFGELLADGGALPARRAVEYVLQVCEALALAHANGVIHRDIKPENLFLVRRGEIEIVKVIDFGISKANLTGRAFGDDLSVVRPSAFMGTPRYMSPEQIRSTDDVDHRTDIWAIGVVLYELLTGSTAFGPDTFTQVCAMVCEGAPLALAEVAPDVDPRLQAVIDRCLEKNVERRFQSVADLAFALLPFASSRARFYAGRSSSILGGPDRGASVRPQAFDPADDVAAVSQDSPVPPVARSYGASETTSHPRRLAVALTLGLCALVAVPVARKLSQVPTPGALVTTTIVPAPASNHSASPRAASPALLAGAAPELGIAVSGSTSAPLQRLAAPRKPNRTGPATPRVPRAPVIKSPAAPSSTVLAVEKAGASVERGEFKAHVRLVDDEAPRVRLLQ